MSDVKTYGTFERGLHRLAFAVTRAQLGLADVEEGIFSEALARVELERPLFVAGLPRAGTTLLLEMLCATGEFASHTYRDMPFVLCPMIWERLSRSFRQPAALHQRAHADGMEIGFDSPEALEEVVWRRFWAKKYQDTHIELWSGHERNAEFEDFLSNHMRKIVALRSSEDATGSGRRYVSKNNANIARLALLGAIFPEARFLVPFRQPMAHISSLIRQHRHFSELHLSDRFARDYMGWLGHFEFGSDVRPIDFNGWVSGGGRSDLDDPAFWASYWLAAYSHLLDLAADRVIFVDYDQLCAEPAESLENLASGLELVQPRRLIGQAERLRRPTDYDARGLGLPQGLAGEIAAIHERLKLQAVQTVAGGTQDA